MSGYAWSCMCLCSVLPQTFSFLVVSLFLCLYHFFEFSSSDHYHEDPPVPKNLSRLYHKCTRAGCSFCEWRKHNTIDIGWEKLLDEPSMKLCGVDLTSSQIADPHHELSLTESLWRWILFPPLDSEFEQALTQIEYSAVVEDSLTARSESTNQPCTSTSVTMAKTIAFGSTSTHAYCSPKGDVTRRQYS